MEKLKFRAIIPEHNATIYFDLTDLIHPSRKDLFSKRELLIPWLLAGNIPDQYSGKEDITGREIYEGDKVRWHTWDGYQAESIVKFDGGRFYPVADGCLEYHRFDEKRGFEIIS
jgi:hypothetical protein